MTDPEVRDRNSNLGAWLPLALGLGGALALLRTWAYRSSLQRFGGEFSEREAELLTWTGSEAYFEFLAVGLACGLLCALLAVLAALLHGRGRHLLGHALGLVVWSLLVAALSGFPLGPRGHISRFHGEWAADELGLAMGLALVLTLAILRLARSHGALRRILSGPVALGSALVLALGLPATLAWRIGANAPTFVLDTVQVDFLATPNARVVIEQNEALAPSVTVITPAVSQHTDSADKPALWMPPPCQVDLLVPELPGALRLHAAAGVDKSVRARLPAGLATLGVDFEVLVNAASVFKCRIDSDRPRPGVWDPSRWVWQHVGTEGQGLAVRAGDVISLRTSLPAGEDPAALALADLKVGFGGLVLANPVERERRRSSPAAPNIVLVVMDTQRADRLSCYGYPKPTTPNLDALALRGTLFEAAYSTSSWTWPSTASILTGLSADAHGVVSNESCTLNLAHESLAEVLQRRGYTTAAFSCNPLIAPQRYFNQGFESFDYHVPDFRMSDEVMPAVLRWVRKHAGTRFFLYLHLADPHTPHRPHPEELVRLGGTRPSDFPERGVDALAATWINDPEGARQHIPMAHQRWISDEYDASVATGDRWLGELMRLLDDLDLSSRTIFAFTSDHGEELLEHGRLGHGHSLYEELVHVPLILAGPGIPHGVRDPAVTSNRHLAPTLAHLGGAELPGMGDARLLLQGAVGAPACFQTVKGRWDELKRQQLYGLRSEDWVLHWRGPGPSQAGELGGVRLYAGTDALQLHDVSAQHEDVALELLGELERRLEAQRAFAPEHQSGVGASGLETLYNIGYAGRDEDE